ncbi:MAG: hypothetical protein B0D96_01610 [Candidatus Sedimenticola endophacoides]|uniref:Uncharacterized protein n=1 Tax=Candidatus Sedimenticola endophacoides TaxID=2548426 RepID=A0A657Q6D1_9GAMM|nr:MAG: hypothetical protein B0D94_10490 [Candidatus Sedimenticola endophacoides]OQX37686.1 MAG: hypothetical protein B0D96_01610 [Candidatus Sedimenticola endophacoides]OQX39059.1 MAG: hypothetical protein B0D89_11495 [Candidatus Sedimenticola endophacoides]OQX42430.1 MAG: hypothetical protein B0D88_06635 [Candidatus Sedimenticola endophacoides]OQX43826.1 MAG: hypothetical protein B0D83_00755 [Candidatus Sedimenticola endophacoides]
MKETLRTPPGKLIAGIALIEDTTHLHRNIRHDIFSICAWRGPSRTTRAEAQALYTTGDYILLISRPRLLRRSAAGIQVSATKQGKKTIDTTTQQHFTTTSMALVLPRHRHAPGQHQSLHEIAGYLLEAPERIGNILPLLRPAMLCILLSQVLSKSVATS